MGHDDAGPFEWANAWVETSRSRAPEASAPDTAAGSMGRTGPAEPVRQFAPAAEDQLMRDIVDIERRRDALAAMPVAAGGTAVAFVHRRTQALTLVPARTSDGVPVLIGGVLALVMLTVFGAAAAMTRLAR
jgi:hypothetical protein